MKSHYLVRYFKHLEEDFLGTFGFFSDRNFIARVTYADWYEPINVVYGGWLQLAVKRGIMAWIERKAQMKSCVEMYEVNSHDVWYELRHFYSVSVPIYVVSINSKDKKDLVYCFSKFLFVDNVCPYYTNKRRLLGS